MCPRRTVRGRGHLLGLGREAKADGPVERLQDSQRRRCSPLPRWAIQESMILAGDEASTMGYSSSSAEARMNHGWAYVQSRSHCVLSPEVRQHRHQTDCRSTARHCRGMHYSERDWPYSLDSEAMAIASAKGTAQLSFREEPGASIGSHSRRLRRTGLMAL